MHPHFVGLKRICQNHDHCSTLNKPCHTIRWIYPPLNEPSIHSTKPSANPWALRGPVLLKLWIKSLMKTKKRVGERGEPWGTPLDVSTSLVCSPTSNIATLSTRKDYVHQTRYPSTPASSSFHSKLASILCRRWTECLNCPPVSDAYVRMLHR